MGAPPPHFPGRVSFSPRHGVFAPRSFFQPRSFPPALRVFPRLVSSFQSLAVFRRTVCLSVFLWFSLAFCPTLPPALFCTCTLPVRRPLSCEYIFLFSVSVSFLPSASTLLLPVCLHPFGFFPRLGSLVRVPPRVPTRALRTWPVSPRLVPGLLRACLHAPPPSRFSSVDAPGPCLHAPSSRVSPRACSVTCTLV